MLISQCALTNTDSIFPERLDFYARPYSPLPLLLVCTRILRVRRYTSFSNNNGVPVLCLIGFGWFMPACVPGFQYRYLLLHLYSSFGVHLYHTMYTEILKSSFTPMSFSHRGKNDMSVRWMSYLFQLVRQLVNVKFSFVRSSLKPPVASGPSRHYPTLSCLPCIIVRLFLELRGIRETGKRSFLGGTNLFSLSRSSQERDHQVYWQ